MKTKTATHTPLNFHTSCGCKIVHLPEGATINKCPLHDAAQELLAVAEELDQLLGMAQEPRFFAAHTKLRIVIAKAYDRRVPKVFGPRIKENL